MTSLSRRKRRTTPWRTTPRRTGISLAVLVAAAAGAAAQPPALPPVPAPPASQPAVPGRVILFRKPADSAQPPGKIEPLTKPREKSDEPTTPPTSTPPGGRTRREVARLEGDEQLLRRLVEELKSEERERERERLKSEPTSRPREAPPASYFEVPPLETIVPVGTPYVSKPVREGYPAMRSLLEPDYVVHRRLYFEEKNSERYGWDLGITQPIVSALYFYKDVLLWPAKLASNPLERYDTSAGKCLPGSPVPYYLYPPEVDLFGATVGAAT
ncbi:MAG TPA: hypothetical protein VFG68_20955, partial [Fimbriiglobus sp.]|nr:hypothetical protein [Fimbriiglobus sp.]